jgi:HAD superfamily hydrolase (TIGR01509 family)
MRRYDYILLDWDGNIAHTLNVWPDALGAVLQKHRYYLTHQQLIDSTWGFAAYIVEHTNISYDEALRIHTEASDLVTKNAQNVELFPGVRDVLFELKEKGKHLALVTTSEYRMIAPTLEKFELLGLFEAIITDDDIEKVERKPHPKPLQMALERMGGVPEAAIMVGDRDKDIIAGHNAGMASALFCGPEHRLYYNFDTLVKCQPTYVMAEFSDLLTIV